MPVDLRLMRYVIAVADAGSFQAAAAQLHIAQPPLSRQVRALERELGVALFHRRPTRLTEPGRVFVDAAREILRAADDAVARTREAGGADVGTVRLGYGPTTAWEEMPALLAGMRDRHPGIELATRELWDAELVAGLLDGTLDAGLGRNLEVPDGCAAVVLRRERWRVGVVADHPLAGRDAVALRDLRGHTFQAFDRALAPRYYDALIEAIQSTGETFPVWENPLPGLRHLGLREGRFLLIPAPLAPRLPGPLACLPLADPVPDAELLLVWSPDATDPALTRLVETARELLADRGAERRSRW
jgi:DNA-binding transcriptional LysR family regulator